MNVVPFRQWAGQPLPNLRSIPTPTADVWLHHGASGTSSLATIRAYLRHHVNTNGWATIGYSFLIAGGVVYEGRGPGRQGAHTHGQNRTSHGIVIAGDYDARTPNPEDIDALVRLLRHGHKMRWWRTPALSGGHRDAPDATTSCPGAALHDLIPDINRQAAGRPEPEKGWLEMATEQDLRRIVREEIAAATGGRDVGTDLQRLRRSVRAIAHEQGLPTEHPVEGGYKVEA